MASPFDPLNPKLCAAGLAADECVRVIHKCILDETLLPLIRAGEGMSEKALAVANALREGILGQPGEEEFPVAPLIDVSLRELSEILGVFISILSPLPLPDCDLDSVKEFAESTTIHKSSRKNIVLKGLRQHNFYKDLMSDFVSSCSASALYGDKVHKAVAYFRADGATLAGAAEIIGSFCTWSSELRKGAVDELRDLMMGFLGSQAEHLTKLMASGQGSRDDLETCATLKTAVGCLSCLSENPDYIELTSNVSATYSALQGSLQTSIVVDAVRACMAKPSMTIATSLLASLDTASSTSLSDTEQSLVTSFHKRILDHILVNVKGGEASNSEMVALVDVVLKVASVYEGAFATPLKENVDSAATLCKSYLDVQGAAAKYLVESSPEALDTLTVSTKKLSASASGYSTSLGHAQDSDSDSGENAFEFKTWHSKLKDAFQSITQESQNVVVEASKKSVQNSNEHAIAAQQALADIAGGAETGKSWKEGLAANATLKSVAAHSKASIGGDDSGFGARVVAAFNELKQAGGTRPRQDQCKDDSEVVKIRSSREGPRRDRSNIGLRWY